jgi:phosphoenolpyruvate carboxykinase (ATP)
MNIIAHPKERLLKALKDHPDVIENPSRETMIREAVENKEALISESGALATWTPVESTGRSPKDTVTVRRASSENNIDWTSQNNIPIDEETFNMIFEDALSLLFRKKRIYVTDRVVGADVSYALPVKMVTSHALHSLFTDNMFRPIPDDIHRSIFGDRGFYILQLPYDKLTGSRYEGRLRRLADGSTSTMAVAMDYDRRLGVIVGSAYCGTVKKMIFTVMNYYLPLEGILPLHCSANEGSDGSAALLLGLSGTGKTSLSADPDRALLGDDEHGWSDTGIANFEYGCYAKMIDINPQKEKDIYDAVMHRDHYLHHGAILENAMIYPNGRLDYCDGRFTENSRASYPLTYLKNIKKSSITGHPRTILFLTADAYGVLPPVSKLDPDQAMLWFLMGYTSKLAGTETGITKPQATFSRFFGQPFMPCNPHMYSDKLGEKMKKHHTRVFLINTGWSGGAYGTGKRIDIVLTRKMVNAALSGDLDTVEYAEEHLFHLNIPLTCPGVPSDILFPRNTWSDKEAYDETAKSLAVHFSEAFDKSYGGKGIKESVVRQCPGK